MQAVVRRRYGHPDVLELAEIPKPTPAKGHVSIFKCRRALRPGGTYVLIGGSTARLFQVMLLGPLLSMTGTRKFVGLASETTSEDLVAMTRLLEAGEVTPVIDRRYALRDVADALRYLETGRARGKVVIAKGA